MSADAAEAEIRHQVEPGESGEIGLVREKSNPQDFAIQFWTHMLDEAMGDKTETRNARRVDESVDMGVLYDAYESLMSDTSVPNYLRTKELCDDRAEYFANVLADLDAGEDLETWIEAETD